MHVDRLHHGAAGFGNPKKRTRHTKYKEKRRVIARIAESILSNEERMELNSKMTMPIVYWANVMGLHRKPAAATLFC
jgi:hypothetical protein